MRVGLIINVQKSSEKKHEHFHGFILHIEASNCKTYLIRRLFSAPFEVEPVNNHIQNYYIILFFHCFDFPAFSPNTVNY